jgi:hypothetical protein
VLSLAACQSQLVRPSGDFQQLKEIDLEGGVKVEVAISVHMTSLAAGATVWTNSVTGIGSVDEHDVPAVVAGMNQTMGRALERLLTPAPASAPSKGN